MHIHTNKGQHNSEKEIISHFSNFFKDPKDATLLDQLKALEVFSRFF